MMQWGTEVYEQHYNHVWSNIINITRGWGASNFRNKCHVTKWVEILHFYDIVNSFFQLFVFSVLKQLMLCFCLQHMLMLRDSLDAVLSFTPTSHPDYKRLNDVTAGTSSVVMILLLSYG